MCGRTRVSMAPHEVAAAVGLSEDAWRGRGRYRASCNVSPGHDTPVVRLSGDGSSKQLHTMRWGLVPSFTAPSEQRPDHFRMMNARSETVAEKPVFRRLLERKRCLVPINGFYEWRQEAGKKQPYHVHLGEGTLMMLAGLYDCWRHGRKGGDSQQGKPIEGRGGRAKGLGEEEQEEEEEEEELLYTYTILTTDSSKPIRWLHDRMPVILRTPEAQEQWLRCGVSGKGCNALSTLCSPYQGEDLAAFPVTPAMSKATYQGSDACKELKRNTVLGMFAKAKCANISSNQGAQPARPADQKQQQQEQEGEDATTTPAPEGASGGLAGISRPEGASVAVKEGWGTKNKDGVEQGRFEGGGAARPVLTGSGRAAISSGPEAKRPRTTTTPSRGRTAVPVTSPRPGDKKQPPISAFFAKK